MSVIVRPTSSDSPPRAPLRSRSLTTEYPTAAQTFTRCGVSSFELQYWNGTGWITVTGGSVTANNKVWRKFTFSAVTTDKVRVLVNNALNSQSRLVEVEAWQGAESSSNGVDIEWMVSDQLATPRMIADKTGSLSGIKRHDYLPFGEELFAGTGGRTTQQGYSGTDNVRQKFTQKERDVETGLDYFGARYYSSPQGRFTSTDPLMASANLANPQTWNRYSYTWNNPTNLVDPLGLDPQQDGKSFTVNNPCQVDGTSQCGPAFNMQVTVTAEPDLIPTTDIQIVTELQTMTGVENPIPPAGYTESLLNSFNGSANGATIGSVAVAGSRTPEGAVGAGVVVGGLITGAIVLDLLHDTAGTDPTALPRPIPLAPPLPYKADPLQTVYRVFGGISQQAGFSWTPIDPRTVPNYRDAAGLPPENSGDFLVTGEVRTSNILIIRPAIPIPPNRGGLTEYVINPASVINQRVSPLIPPL